MLGAALAVLVALVVALASPAVARADSQLTHGYLRYEVSDNSVTIVDYAGDEEEVWVPAYIAGKPVNRITTGAFSDSLSVHKIYLPDTVTTTDDGAFAEDQEVIFDWNVGRGGAEDDQNKDSSGGDKSGNKDGDKDGDKSGDQSGSSGNKSGGTTGNNQGTNDSSNKGAAASNTADGNTAANRGTSTTGGTNATTTRTQTAQTGDPTSMVLPVVLACAAVAVIAVAVVARRKAK